METTLFYHRGGGKSLGYPPNCIKTIEWAVENGAKGLEYDVVAAKFGEEYRVVMVEPGLVKENGLEIDELDWDDLKDIDAGNRKTGRCQIAMLEEVLKTVDQNETRQQIHIKGENPETVPALVDELENLTSITVTSFDLEVLHRVNTAEPDVRLGWIVKPDSSSGTEGTQDLTDMVTSSPGALQSYTGKELEEIKRKARDHDIGTVILCAPKIESRDTIEFFREDGFRVGGWGVGSNLETARRLISLGIDRFTIDNPEEIRG